VGESTATVRSGLARHSPARAGLDVCPFRPPPQASRPVAPRCERLTDLGDDDFQRDTLDAGVCYPLGRSTHQCAWRRNRICAHLIVLVLSSVKWYVAFAVAVKGSRRRTGRASCCLMFVELFRVCKVCFVHDTFLCTCCVLFVDVPARSTCDSSSRSRRSRGQSYTLVARCPKPVGQLCGTGKRCEDAHGVQAST
jgi:hypothetical protein